MIKLYFRFKISIDWDIVLDKIATFLIKKKAYKGYCLYCDMPPKEEVVEPKPKHEFYQFESWKIRLSYMILLRRTKKIDKNTMYYTPEWCIRQYFKQLVRF